MNDYESTVIFIFFLTDSESDEDPTNKYVTVIPVGFGEQEEKDKSPSSSLRLKSSLKNPIPFHKQNGGLTRTMSGLISPPEIVITESESESESDRDNICNNFTLRAGDSFNRRALTALKELDAVMAAEVSDLDAGSSALEIGHRSPSNATLSPKSSPRLRPKSISFTEEVMVHSPPPPPRKLCFLEYIEVVVKMRDLEGKKIKYF